MSSPAEKGFIPYKGLRILLRAAVLIFFRRIEVVGLENVPEEGPTLFCANHSNSMLDPLMITVFSGRIVHFAAADILFENPVLRFCLRIMGAVPIRRRQDHGGGGQNNDDSFAALYSVLREGRSMGIFPEGLSHDDPHLAELKTGPARLALGAASEHTQETVQIVPCGFYYTDARRFRSLVLLQFGEPIEMTPERIAEHAQEPRATVRAVTDDLEMSIRGLTVNAEDWDTARVIDGIRRMYQPERIRLVERMELSRRFNDRYAEVKDDPGVQLLAERVRAYQDSLYLLGLRDRDVQRGLPTSELIWRTVSYGLLFVVYLPLAIVGAPLHAPLGVLLKLGGARLSPRKDTIAATKLLGGFFLILILYGMVTAAAFWCWSLPIAVATAVLLPISGWSFIHVVSRARTLGRLYATAAEMILMRRQIKRLKDERKALCVIIHDAVDRLIPEDLERLFPSRTEELLEKSAR
jgi:glycerol-3-phosphate O-acyltransferase/dihydroxyacetone phosphate acyltransferase